MALDRAKQPMRRFKWPIYRQWWLLATLIAAVGVYYVSGDVFARYRYGTLICPESHFDFGAVDSSVGNLAHHFRLVNTSLRTIRISSVKTSCNCTAAQVDMGPIPPGTGIDVVATINLQGKIGVSQSAVFLQTEPPLPGPLILSMDSNVRVHSSLAPNVLHFGSIVPGQIVSRNVTFLSGNIDPNAHIVGRVVEDDRIEIRTSKKTSDTLKVGSKEIDSFDLTLSTKMDDIGTYNDRVVFQIAGGESASLPLSIDFNVVRGQAK